MKHTEDYDTALLLLSALAKQSKSRAKGAK